MNGPKTITLESWKMIRQAAKGYGELKKYKKALMVREKGASKLKSMSNQIHKLTLKNVWMKSS